MLGVWWFESIPDCFTLDRQGIHNSLARQGVAELYSFCGVAIGIIPNIHALSTASLSIFFFKDIFVVEIVLIILASFVFIGVMGTLISLFGSILIMTLDEYGIYSNETLGGRFMLASMTFMILTLIVGIPTAVIAVIATIHR